MFKGKYTAPITYALLLLICFLISNYYRILPKDVVKQAEKELHKKESIAQKGLEKLHITLQSSNNTPYTTLEKQLKPYAREEHISFYVYKNDTLCYWTSNQPAIDLVPFYTEKKSTLIHLRNGWYELLKLDKLKNSVYSCMALITIKPEYDFQNDYLKNEFVDWLYLPEGTQLKEPTLNNEAYTVKTKEGDPLFTLSDLYPNNQTYLDEISSLLFICFSILVLYVIHTFFQNNQKTFKHPLLLLSVLVVFLRFLMITFHYPDSFYALGLYSAKKFADADSFWYSFLGDILINSFLTVSLSVIIYQRPFLVFKNRLWLYLLVILGVASLHVFAFSINSLVNSLIFNSTISYNINRFYDMEALSFTALLFIAVLMLSYYFFSEKLIRLILYQKTNHFLLTAITIVLSMSFSLFILNWYNLSFFEAFWPTYVIVLIYLLRLFKASYNFINTGLLIGLFAFICFDLFHKYELKNKLANYNAFVNTLSDEQDPVLESEFVKITNDLPNDKKLHDLMSFTPLSNESIEQRLKHSYFTGYLERYDIAFSLFDSKCVSVFKNIDSVYQNDYYYENQISTIAQKTDYPNLFFISNDKGDVKYIAKISTNYYALNSNKPYLLYVELSSKKFSEAGKFPDLLLDKSFQSRYKSNDFSYAIYKKRELIIRYGDYNYPSVYKWNLNFKTSDEGVFENSYHHYFFRSHENIIVISDQQYGFWYAFTSNSYLFLFFSIIVLASLFIGSLIYEKSFFVTSLNARIQTLVVLVIIVALVSIGFGTITLVSKQFEENNNKELIEKSYAIISDLKETICKQDTLQLNQKDHAIAVLKRLANLFGSDITLFNTQGYLYASSQLKLYDQSIVSKFMNPDAYISFKTNLNSEFITKDIIGEFKFSSSYVPLYNKKGSLLGYLNLPYFARQQGLEKDLTIYLTTIINIYVILFVVGTIIALFISNLVTKPLRIIKQQISNISLDKHNEPLKWKSNDEIGRLITEYNRMLVKLEDSAQLLAKSERESAWREMAKQVAHEIKNPLTPMKLSIQHLQRISENPTENTNDYIQKVSGRLIEQIDTLSHIATEFSNFAKMPAGNMEYLNLTTVVNDVVDLFKEEISDIVFTGPESAYIYADKDQIIRVMTNLLKNATQAIPENRAGKIKVTISNTEKHIVLTITDNGIGVSDEVKDRIFTPNFTTKSSGMGLGLSMVKKIIQQHNGKIWFDSIPNEGTIFYIEFPKAYL